MSDANEVIQALGCLVTKQPKCVKCSYNPIAGLDWPYGCIAGQVRIVEDARELLRQTIPRVLTYDEARDNAMRYMNPDSVKPVFIEFREKLDEEEDDRPAWRGGYNQRVLLMNQPQNYGKAFRFWTDRPNEDQQKDAKW